MVTLQCFDSMYSFYTKFGLIMSLPVMLTAAVTLSFGLGRSMYLSDCAAARGCWRARHVQLFWIGLFLMCKSQQQLCWWFCFCRALSLIVNSPIVPRTVCNRPHCEQHRPAHVAVQGRGRRPVAASGHVFAL